MAARARAAPAAPRADAGAARRAGRASPAALDGHDLGPRRAAGPRDDHPGRARRRRLAGFLRALHVAAPADAPSSTDRGAHPRDVTDGFEGFLRAVAPDDSAAVRSVWADAVAAPAWEGPPVWVHGDLHPANVVVADGTLAGVVDFGDLFAGDPAWDLAAAWVLLPAGLAARFFDAYAEADDAAVRRARGLAALKALFLLLMGQNGERGLPGGKAHWGPAGRTALDRVLAG
nr:phosphotransferase [Cellulosimicrobium aquatile]